MLLNIANFLARWTFIFQTSKKMPLLKFWANKFKDFSRSWNFVRRFTLGGAVVMLLGMVGIGWWVGEEIKASVIKEATAATALYMDSFIAPNIQELAHNESISPERVALLGGLFAADNLGQQTVSVKIWSGNHTIVFSNIPELIGRKFPDTVDLVSSFDGHVTGEISNLLEAENIEERRLSKDPLLEIYSPVRENGTNRIIAVAEFYQKVDNLNQEIFAAQRTGWLLVGTTMAFVYLLLVGFVRWGGTGSANKNRNWNTKLFN